MVDRNDLSLTEYTDPRFMVAQIDPAMAITARGCVELALTALRLTVDPSPRILGIVESCVSLRLTEPPTPRADILSTIDPADPNYDQTVSLAAIALDTASYGLMTPEDFDKLYNQPGAADEQVAALAQLRKGTH